MADFIKDLPTSRKTVRFAEDKDVIYSDSIALSIVKVQGRSGKLDTYSVKMHSAGMSWHVNKKFQDFVEFHKKLTEEVSDRSMDAQLPTLPNRSLLKHMKWLNSEYTKQKVERLEKYLRSLLRTSVLKRASRVLRDFLELEKLYSSENRVRNGSRSTVSTDSENTDGTESGTYSDTSVGNGEYFMKSSACNGCYEGKESNINISSHYHQCFVDITDSDGFDTDDEEYSPEFKYCLAKTEKEEIII